eukprot:5979238-Pleurochrysis_carterae.AAC.2
MCIFEWVRPACIEGTKSVRPSSPLEEPGNNGDESAPRSAGCSKMKSAPAALAARTSCALRRTSSLD